MNCQRMRYDVVGQCFDLLRVKGMKEEIKKWGSICRRVWKDNDIFMQRMCFLLWVYEWGHFSSKYIVTAKHNSSSPSPNVVYWIKLHLHSLVQEDTVWPCKSRPLKSSADFFCVASFFTPSAGTVALLLFQVREMWARVRWDWHCPLIVFNYDYVQLTPFTPLSVLLSAQVFFSCGCLPLSAYFCYVNSEINFF